MQIHEAGYFLDRSRQEREAAAKAGNPKAAAIHEDLAARYEAVAEAFAALDRARMSQP